jgi:hypothetical protein
VVASLCSEEQVLDILFLFIRWWLFCEKRAMKGICVTNVSFFFVFGMIVGGKRKERQEGIFSSPTFSQNL